MEECAPFWLVALFDIWWQKCKQGCPGTDGVVAGTSPARIWNIYGSRISSCCQDLPSSPPTLPHPSQARFQECAQYYQKGQDAGGADGEHTGAFLYVISCYSLSSTLFLHKTTLQSAEGVQQDDPPSRLPDNPLPHHTLKNRIQGVLLH